MSEQHVTANTDMDQAIPRLAGRIVSGRAEDSMLPQANRAIHPGICLVWNRPRNL